VTTNTSPINTPNTTYNTNRLVTHTFGLLCLCVPLFSINAADVFYYSCLALLLASCGYLIGMRPSFSLQQHEMWLVIAFFAYPLWAGSDMLLRDTWNWNEFKEPSRFILVIPIFFAIRSLKIPLEYLFAGIILGAVWAGMQGVYQGSYLNVYRAGGGASHVTAFGNISLLLGMMSLASIAIFKKHKPLIVGIAVIALCAGIIASMSSGSKGGWISLPLLFWIAIDLLGNPTYKKRFASLGVMLLIATLAFFSSDLVQSRVSAVIPALLEYFTSGGIIDGSVGPRLETWGASWAIFIQNPIFGAGVGGYFEAKALLIEQGVIDPLVATFVQSHNQLLHSLAEGGLLGMACVYGIYTSLILVFRKTLTSNKPVAVSGLMLTIAFMDFGMADGIWSITNAGTFFAVIAVIFAGFVSGTKPAS